MQETKFIKFDNVIVRVDEIMNVEFPETIDGKETKFTIITNLKSGRSITTTCPDEYAYAARKRLYDELLNPVDWDKSTVEYAEEFKKNNA